jgi:hypothetical protein
MLRPRFAAAALTKESFTKRAKSAKTQLPKKTMKTLERETGIEPATNSLEGCDSTTELLPLHSASPSSTLRSLDFARDLASRLPLRSRLLNGSTWKAVTLPLSYSRSVIAVSYQLSVNPSLNSPSH